MEKSLDKLMINQSNKDFGTLEKLISDKSFDDVGHFSGFMKNNMEYEKEEMRQQKKEKFRELEIRDNMEYEKEEMHQQKKEKFRELEIREVFTLTIPNMVQAAE